MMHGDVEPDDGAITPADDRGLLESEMIHQGQNVPGHQIVTEGLRIAAGSSVAAAVHHDDLVVSFERPNLVTPVICVGEAAMQHHDRLAVAKGRVPDLDAVEGNESAPDCLG